MKKNANDYAAASYGEKLQIKRAPSPEKQAASASLTAIPSGANKRKSSPEKQARKIKIAFLGGLNEIGKNMTLIEFNNEMIIIDCGLAFPEAELPGVDIVLPDFSYVERNAGRVKGVFITHGHEDHIGGLPYLMKTLDAPVYATRLTAGLVQGKLEEQKFNLPEGRLNTISPGDVIRVGGFTIEAIHVNHSIPDALAFAICTAAGTIVHTGDFKIDCTPIDGEIIDLARLSQLGKEGVLCLLADSTNAERPGYTPSERKVGESFENLFTKAGKRRLIVATFATNIHRIQQIVDVAVKTGRKVCLSGRSVENVVRIGMELDYLNIPDGVLIELDALKNYTDDKVVLITTGSQGEPMSALTRMASGDHRKVSVGPNDCVIISATPIPGNEKTIGRVINDLLKLGAQVIYESMYDVHVSGHACQEELKLMIGLVRPQYFIPVHGEQKHMRRHALLACSMGIPKKNIILADNGIEVEVSRRQIRISGTVPSGRVLVDGNGVGEIGSSILRDRLHLGQDGVVIVSFSVDTASCSMLTKPEIISRGFIYDKDSEELFSEAVQIVCNAAQKFEEAGYIDIPALTSRVKDEISRYLYDRTRRRPMVVPVISEVN